MRSAAAVTAVLAPGGDPPYPPADLAVDALSGSRYGYAVGAALWIAAGTLFGARVTGAVPV